MGEALARQHYVVFKNQCLSEMESFANYRVSRKKTRSNYIKKTDKTLADRMAKEEKRMAKEQAKDEMHKAVADELETHAVDKKNMKKTAFPLNGAITHQTVRKNSKIKRALDNPTPKASDEKPEDDEKAVEPIATSEALIPIGTGRKRKGAFAEPTGIAKTPATNGQKPKVPHRGLPIPRKVAPKSVAKPAAVTPVPGSEASGLGFADKCSAVKNRADTLIKLIKEAPTGTAANKAPTNPVTKQVRFATHKPAETAPAPKAVTAN